MPAWKHRSWTLRHTTDHAWLVYYIGATSAYTSQQITRLTWNDHREMVVFHCLDRCSMDPVRTARLCATAQRDTNNYPSCPSYW